MRGGADEHNRGSISGSPGVGKTETENKGEVNKTGSTGSIKPVVWSTEGGGGGVKDKLKVIYLGNQKIKTKDGKNKKKNVTEEDGEETEKNKKVGYFFHFSCKCNFAACLMILMLFNIPGEVPSFPFPSTPSFPPLTAPFPLESSLKFTFYCASSKSQSFKLLRENINLNISSLLFYPTNIPIKGIIYPGELEYCFYM